MSRKPSRIVRLSKIGQAHLAPGMSLAQLERIFNKYQINTWNGIADETIDAIINEIAAIVRAQRRSNTHQSGIHHQFDVHQRS